MKPRFISQAAVGAMILLTAPNDVATPHDNDNEQEDLENKLCVDLRTPTFRNVDGTGRGQPSICPPTSNKCPKN